jgi:hypothetical protein
MIMDINSIINKHKDKVKVKIHPKKQKNKMSLIKYTLNMFLYQLKDSERKKTMNTIKIIIKMTNMLIICLKFKINFYRIIKKMV